MFEIRIDEHEVNTNYILTQYLIFLKKMGIIQNQILKLPRRIIIVPFSRKAVLVICTQNVWVMT